jgi:ribonuclease P protein component
MRVRRMGKSYAHPLLVLVVHPNELGETRAAVTAGKSLGNAVRRNRAKRLLREAVRPLLPQIPLGWDIVLVARRPLEEAAAPKAQQALLSLLKRAHLWNEEKDGV